MVAAVKNAGGLQECSLLSDPLLHVEMLVNIIVILDQYLTPVMQCILLLSSGEVMSSVTPEWTEKQEWITGKQTDWGKENEMK